MGSAQHASQNELSQPSHHLNENDKCVCHDKCPKGNSTHKAQQAPEHARQGNQCKRKARRARRVERLLPAFARGLGLGVGLLLALEARAVDIQSSESKQNKDDLVEVGSNRLWCSLAWAGAMQARGEGMQARDADSRREKDEGAEVEHTSREEGMQARDETEKKGRKSRLQTRLAWAGGMQSRKERDERTGTRGAICRSPGSC